MDLGPTTGYFYPIIKTVQSADANDTFEESVLSHCRNACLCINGDYSLLLGVTWMVTYYAHQQFGGFRPS